MRYGKWRLILIVLLAVPAAVQAQAPKAPVSPAPSDSKLDQLLARWEKEMASLQTMQAHVICKRTSKAFKRSEELVGTAKFMRPDLARLELKSQANPQHYERYICTGSHIYNFLPEDKVIQVHSLPAKQPGAEQLPDEGPLPFIFGMKAETAKNRYDLKIVKEDQGYTYVQVKPKFPRDQADFTAAMLSVQKDNFMPRQLLLLEPNGNEVQWDIKHMERNARIPRSEFAKPDTRGWKLETVPSQASAPQPRPRVVRPQAEK